MGGQRGCVACLGKGPRRTGAWRPLLGLTAAVPAAVLLAGTALAQVASLYYQEVKKDGSICVFNTPERYEAFARTGEVGAAITLIGRGPHGETVLAENETALDLFLFKHDLPAYDRTSTKPALPAPATFPQVKVGSTAFLSWQDGTSSGADYSKFVVKRAYVNVDAKLTSFLSARITPDVTQDSTTGEMKYRLKYAYGTFSTPRLGYLAQPFLSFGMVQTPWLDFEEKINVYRMQDTLFLERVGLISSADVGVVLGGLFAGEMPESYQKSVSSAYPGRYGSFAIGVYNGGGYTAAEKNTNKAIEGRLSIRPLPDVAPGLQLSYFGVTGKGNVAAEPDWKLNATSLSFESRNAAVLATYTMGRGNLSGTAVDVTGKALNYDAWSVFAEAKLSPSWSLIGRYDEATPDTRTTSIKTKRTIGGVAYHLGKGNDILLDHDEVRYEGTTKPNDARTQLTLQIKF